MLGKCGFGGKWGKGRQVGTVWHQRERSLGFAPMERAKEAVNAARMKAWAAMPRLPQLPPLPPKVTDLGVFTLIQGTSSMKATTNKNANCHYTCTFGKTCRMDRIRCLKSK